MSEEQSKYMVSIRCMTYNHAPYIEDAMNGFCMQETDFPFVAIIVDDASTDSESEVIKAYLHEHFDMDNAHIWSTEDACFIEVSHIENQNCTFAVVLLKYNFVQAKKSKEPLIKEWMNCNYIALCEGDDFWICPTKLQEQVNFLDSHKECDMVYSNVRKLNQKDNTVSKSWCKRSNFVDMLKSNKVCTLTTCFSKNIYDSYLQEIRPHEKKWRIGDYPMWLYFFANSKPYYMDKVMGIYRILENSASHFHTYRKWEKFVNSFFDISIYFAEKYGYKDYARKIAIGEVRLIIHESDKKNENTSVRFLPLFQKYKFEMSLFVDAITTHNRFLRKSYCFAKRVYYSTNYRINRFFRFYEK